ncbi:MAG: hypothetical protein PVSMB3_18900 [Candidatus Dormibacteraceae bacterium]
MAQAVEYPLEIGVTTQAPVYEPRARETKRFRVRPHPYDVTLVYPGYDTVVGSCDVIKTGANTFVVRPNFRIAFPAEDVRFWGGFSVDESGTATLDSVYLVPRIGH